MSFQNCTFIYYTFLYSSFSFFWKYFSPLPIFKYFQILFKKVLKGEVTPDHLIRMSPEELASKELAAWRRRENRHVRLFMNMCLSLLKPMFFKPSSNLPPLTLFLNSIFCFSWSLLLFSPFSQVIRFHKYFVFCYIICKSEG